MPAQLLNGMHHIERYATPGYAKHGWRVRIRKGPFRFAKSFLDDNYDGTEQALRKAQKWRDNRLCDIPDYPKGKTAYTTDPKPRANNTSGHVGVTFSEGGWRARWSRNGKPQQQYFSCLVLGYDVAKQKAIDLRSRMVEIVVCDVVTAYNSMDMKGISKTKKGWLVRCDYRDGKGPMYQKLFTASVRGGFSGALRCAIAYRDRYWVEETNGRKKARYEKEGFKREITTELYERVTAAVQKKTRAFEFNNVRSEVEQTEIVQNILLAYASKEGEEITDERHYLNTLIDVTVKNSAQHKARFLFNHPTWVDEPKDDEEDAY